MTVTDLAGLPAEIAAALARAGLAQEAACDEAGMARTSYYRRKRQPGAWDLPQLRRFVRVAGAELGLDLAGHPVDLDALGATSWRLGELATLAAAMGSGLALSLEPVQVGTDA